MARVTAADVVWVGVDTGTASHHAAAVGAGGKRLWSVKVANGQQPVEELFARAAESAGDGEVRWAVDQVSPAAALLLAIVLSSGQDARIIADTAQMCGDLAELAVTNELVVELARLTSYRTDVTADWVYGTSRLRDLLTSIFPVLEASFDYSHRSVLMLVGSYCTPAEVRAAGREALAAYLREHGAWVKGVDAMTAKPHRPRSSRPPRCPARPLRPCWSRGSPASSWTPTGRSRTPRS